MKVSHVGLFPFHFLFIFVSLKQENEIALVTFLSGLLAKLEVDL